MSSLVAVKEILLQLDEQDSVDEFRHQTLSLLDRHFGLDRSIFWLCNEGGEITAPVIRNIKEGAFSQYVNGYQEQDMLLPHKVKDLLLKSRVLRIHDITTSKDYENSRYFNEFMVPNDCYHEMGVYLISRNQLIAGISFVGGKKHSAFGDRSAELLDVLSCFISSKLHYLLQYETHRDSTLPIDFPAHFTPKEKEICSLLKMGLTNKQMADQLFVSTSTIKKHLQNMYTKMGVSSRTKLLHKVKL
ncbi:LuxR C-terminal-related transcriptional regulator [Bacillus salitolerans]|uniref:LuxR C-terminal-related transcriptional regulator n=1 Tax=Bacillus salitolerans TaxID=1437434 RepID=A0ABW4LUD1_9BACI